MRRILSRRPSPALVVACLALGLALGGTGYATGLQIPRNSVGTPQLKNRAVTTAKIANNAVTSAQIRNGTLVKADFKGGQLPPGPAGPAGPSGPAGPPGVSGVERNEVTTTSTSVSPRTAFLACPEGKRLIGGGARVTPTTLPLAIMTSFPDNDNVWRAHARETAATAASWTLTVYTICAVTG